MPRSPTEIVEELLNQLIEEGGLEDVDIGGGGGHLQLQDGKKTGE